MAAVAGVAVPAQSVAAPVVDEPSRFFLFHAEGVSLDTARTDLRFCIDQARAIQAPFHSPGVWAVETVAVGLIVTSVVETRVQEIRTLRMRNAAMRKCMGLLAYDRYSVPEQEWKEIVAYGDIVVDDHQRVDPAVVERMADFASGAAPSGAKLAR